MLGTWVDRLPDLATEFRNGSPFPLVVIDGFLEDDAAERVLVEFPTISSMGRSHDYIFGDKRESSSLAVAGPTCRRLADVLLSSDFSECLREITGRELFMDPSFHGGGFHQGADGSYLDTHVDFNIHPHHNDWLRVLNVLLYLNKDWPSSYGGELLVRRNPAEPPRAIAPVFNRCVMMLTSDFTYHGYRRMSLPPGCTRKSIAGYAYEKITPGSRNLRTTTWAPEDAGLLKRALGKYWPGLAAFRSKVLQRR